MTNSNPQKLSSEELRDIVTKEVYGSERMTYDLATEYAMKNTIDRDRRDSIDKIMEAIQSYASQQVLQALAEAKKTIPFATSTSDELDKANTHLDSHSQKYWHAYNKGYISMSDQTLSALEDLEKQYKEEV